MPQTKLLVLDLNKTLLCRPSATRKGARTPRMRPWLSLFLSYLFHKDSPWQVYVWSSARPENVKHLVELCGLDVPLAPKIASDGETQEANSLADLFSQIRLTQGDNTPILKSSSSSAAHTSPPRLNGMLTRKDMGLPPRQYNSKVETTKDLRKIWEMSEFDTTNTILLDDSAAKAHLQAKNHLNISIYNPFDNPRGAGSDTGLLTTIAVLDHLAFCSDVTTELQDGELIKAKGLDVSAEKGLEIAEKLGLDTNRKEFSLFWWQQLGIEPKSMAASPTS